MTHESIASRILLLRGQRVMLDADLAELYGVPTKALNQAVRRNSRRFPPDFMFQLTTLEKREVVTNSDHLARQKFARTHPFAVDEQGSTRAELKAMVDVLRQLARPAEAPAKRPIGFVVTDERAASEGAGGPGPGRGRKLRAAPGASGR